MVVNAVNLIDGIDGLASGLCFLIIGVFAWLFWKIAPLVYSIMACTLMGTLASFFYYNVFGKMEKGTKTFMGDSGSLILGYAIAYLALKFAMYNPNVLPYRGDALLWSYTILIIPTFDLARVAFGRIARHKSVFDADKTHIHHLIMAAGLSQHQALITILSLFGVFCFVNAALYESGMAFTPIVFIDIAMYVMFFVVLHMKKRANA